MEAPVEDKRWARDDLVKRKPGRRIPQQPSRFDYSKRHDETFSIKTITILSVYLALIAALPTAEKLRKNCKSSDLNLKKFREDVACVASYMVIVGRMDFVLLQKFFIRLTKNNFSFKVLRE